MATKLIFEILEEAASKKTNEEKISVLQKNSSMALKDVLRGTIDSTIQWNLPEGEPPYTACEPHNCPANLLREHKKFKYFVKGLQESESLPAFKRERVFFAMLESVHPRDAELIVAMVNKKMPKGISKNVVEKAFPGLLQG
jgi:hypothetical protein